MLTFVSDSFFTFAIEYIEDLRKTKKKLKNNRDR